MGPSRPDFPQDYLVRLLYGIRTHYELFKTIGLFRVFVPMVFFPPDKIEPIVKVYSIVQFNLFLLCCLHLSTWKTKKSHKSMALPKQGLQTNPPPPGFHEKQVTSQHIWHWQSRCDDMDKQSSGSQPQKSSKKFGKGRFLVFRFLRRGWFPNGL